MLIKQLERNECRIQSAKWMSAESVQMLVSMITDNDRTEKIADEI